jgi:hypothetical protein
MFDDISGWYAGVDEGNIGCSHIVVSPRWLADACRLLANHHIPHAVEGETRTLQESHASTQPAVRLGSD